MALATLHVAAQALAALRGGLTPEAAQVAVPRLRRLLGAPAAALTAGTRLLAWDGVGMEQHGAPVGEPAGHALNSGRPRGRAVGCDDPGCPIRYAAAAPLMVAGRAAGVLCAYGATSSPDLLRATADVAGWISGQLALAELDGWRARLSEAELRALHPHISPHFVFNSLTAIMTLIRTEPERAQDLLQEFCDVARYALRRRTGFATLAEELRSIEPYLALERVRFADRLRVTLRVAPEALPVAVPFLSLQPLVDNAVRHGMERKTGPGRIEIAAAAVGPQVYISVEDDGVGMDPDQVCALLGPGDVADSDPDLRTVHQRLRRVFGEGYGLVVQTRAGVGTKVTMRVPRDEPRP